MVPPPLIRRVRLTALALLATLAALAWVALRPDRAATSQAPVRQAPTTPFTDVHPYGANFFLEREASDWTKRKTVSLARESGVRWAKQQLLWASIEQSPGEFDWSTYDAIVDLFREHDIEVIARLDWPPQWVAKPDWVPPAVRANNNVPPADYGDYARFVGATAEHFKGRVRFYQIWNEPNLVGEWGLNPSHPADPREYARMLHAAAAAARQADPNAVILSAPLAINTETVDIAGNMSDLEFLRGLYEAGAQGDFDILSANAFGMDQPPEAEPDEETLNFRRVELQRAIMEEHGDADTAVWFNEYGWNAAPPDAMEQHWQRVTEEEQAAYTVEGVHWGEERWPWSGVFSIWYFRQWGGLNPERAVYYFRMVDLDWTKRLLFAAVSADAGGRDVATAGDWGERSSPVKLPTDLAARERWTWAWADGAWDRNALVTTEPGAALTFAFEGPEVAVRVMTGPQAGTLVTEIDGRAVRAGADAQGLQLKAPEEGWEWRTLATGLGEGVHELRLSVGTAGGEVAIDGFRVSPAADQGAGVSAALLALAALAAALALSLAADVRRVASRVHV